MNHQLLALYGLKWNPYAPEQPLEAVALRLLAERLTRLADLTVGVLTHPQSNLADFYRELGDLFGVSLQPHNRWGGFKTLRERSLRPSRIHPPAPRPPDRRGPGNDALRPLGTTPPGQR